MIRLCLRICFGQYVERNWNRGQKRGETVQLTVWLSILSKGAEKETVRIKAVEVGSGNRKITK